MNNTVIKKSITALATLTSTLLLSGCLGSASATDLNMGIGVPRPLPAYGERITTCEPAWQCQSVVIPTTNEVIIY